MTSRPNVTIALQHRAEPQHEAFNADIFVAPDAFGDQFRRADQARAERIRDTVLIVGIFERIRLRLGFLHGLRADHLRIDSEADGTAITRAQLVHFADVVRDAGEIVLEIAIARLVLDEPDITELRDDGLADRRAAGGIDRRMRQAPRARR